MTTGGGTVNVTTNNGLSEAQVLALIATNSITSDAANDLILASLGITFKEETDQDYTLILTDNRKLILANSADANSIHIPLNADVEFQQGAQILIRQAGVGATAFVAESGVTIESEGNKLTLAAQFAMATLIYQGADVWILAGNLIA